MAVERSTAGQSMRLLCEGARKRDPFGAGVRAVGSRGQPGRGFTISAKSIAAVTFAAALLGAAVLAQAGEASPTAHTASFSPCDISGKQQDLGTSYVTSLKVQGVGCTKAERVIKAYHDCRHDNGGPEGTCGKTVFGFKCKDGQRTGVPNVQYNATAKCRKVTNSAKRIKSSYTQNT
jgi:hypothetical protein